RRRSADRVGFYFRCGGSILCADGVGNHGRDTAGHTERGGGLQKAAPVELVGAQLVDEIAEGGRRMGHRWMLLYRYGHRSLNAGRGDVLYPIGSVAPNCHSVQLIARRQQPPAPTLPKRS